MLLQNSSKFQLQHREYGEKKPLENLFQSCSIMQMGLCFSNFILVKIGHDDRNDYSSYCKYNTVNHVIGLKKYSNYTYSGEHSPVMYLWGPTNVISIKFKILSKFAVLQFKMCPTVHSEILHFSRQYYCREMCRLLLRSVKYVMNKIIVKFHWISNLIEISKWDTCLAWTALFLWHYFVYPNKSIHARRHFKAINKNSCS